MRISESFPSKWLKADDLPKGKKVRVKIDRVECEAIGSDREMKPVVFFRGTDKGVVLNKTNGGAIVAAYGDETEDWEGKEVFLFRGTALFQGKTVPAIKIEAPMEEIVEEEPLPVEHLAEDDDPVPF